MNSRVTILVSGMIAADPHQGGATWAVLQYVLGLQQLGHDVYFVEPVPRASVLPKGAPLAESENARYFESIVADFDLRARSALLLAGTKETFGLRYDELRRLAHRTDLLINISGMLTDEALTAPIPIRVYLDLDPAFNQLWSATQGVNMRFGGHTHFVTIGQAIGEPGCRVPECGLRWLKMLQPVVLNRWPVASGITFDGFTTIANWRGYGSIEHEGTQYGQKAHSWRNLFSLPGRTHEKFVAALAIHPDETHDLAALASNGWQLLDPAEVAATPRQYQRFIQGSKAEFGVAKSGYVVSRCGWFSDRSVCYLASGRPVLAQQTGFTRCLPVGDGLFAFENVENVLEAIEELQRDYPRHACSARRMAEEFFDSNKVLGGMLDAVGI
jgi:hypothetical protein